MKSINIVVAGGRNFKNYKYLSDSLDEVIFRLNKKGYEKIIIVSGEARGADELGERYAKENGYEIDSYPADWDNLGKAAGFIRNEEMAKVAQLVIVFWDGISKGSKHMIDLGYKYKRTVLVYKY